MKQVFASLHLLHLEAKGQLCQSKGQGFYIIQSMYNLTQAHVCIFVCTHYVYMYIHTCLCIYMNMYACMYAHVYTCSTVRVL